MNAALEKQFLPLGGSVVLIETLKMVHSCAKGAEILLVLPQERFGFWRQLCEKYNCNIAHRLIAGGKERFFSVKAAVEAVEEEDESALVAVHDGVRPFADEEIFSQCFEAAAESGAAVACIDCTDSVRYEDKPIDRTKLKLIHTPQCFKLALLKKAYAQEFDPCFTDDSSLAERVGAKLRFVSSKRRNIKITQPFDLAIAECIINERENQGTVS